MVDGSSGATPSSVADDAGRRHTRLLERETLFAVVWLLPAVLGAVLGIVGWLISGFPWWPLIGAVALWWVAFLLPRYWPGLRSHRWSLRTELLLMLYPRKGVERMRAEEERHFRRAAFPLYGLPASFPGERYLSSFGTGGSWRHGTVVRWLSLGHGDQFPFPGGTWLLVETAPGRTAPSDAERRQRLARRLWTFEQLAAVLKRDQLPQGRLRAARRPDPQWPSAWSSVRIAIDGTPVDFEYLANGENWAAWAVHGDLVLSLFVSRVPVDSVTLIAVTDLQPYIDGRRRRDAAASCPVPPPQALSPPSEATLSDPD